MKTFFTVLIGSFLICCNILYNECKLNNIKNKLDDSIVTEEEFNNIVSEYDNQQDIIYNVDIDDNEIKPIEINYINYDKEYKYSISEAGKQHIKEFESCRLKKYKINGKYSIGWGHLIKKGEHYETITQEKADELFEYDIAWVNESVNNLLKPLNKNFMFSQGFIDGLASLIYNCGETGIRNTEFYKRLLKCRYDESIGNINQYDYKFTISAVKTTNIIMKGHIRRRQAEYNMMASL